MLNVGRRGKEVGKRCVAVLYVALILATPRHYNVSFRLKKALARHPSD